MYSWAGYVTLDRTNIWGERPSKDSCRGLSVRNIEIEKKEIERKRERGERER